MAQQVAAPNERQQPQLEIRALQNAAPRCSLSLGPAPHLMKQLAFVVFVSLVLLVLVLGSLRVIQVQRPSMPQRWSQLRRGMTPEQVRSTVADEVYDLRAVQGFDLVTHMNPNGHWQMIVRYDPSGSATNATARYIHTSGFGLLNSGGKRVL